MTSKIQIIPAAQVFYENTIQFRDYLYEKARWEKAHAAYVESSNPQTRNQLVIREHAMRVCLRLARETQEHKDAFGWRYEAEQERNQRCSPKDLCEKESLA